MRGAWGGEGMGAGRGGGVRAGGARGWRERKLEL